MRWSATLTWRIEVTDTARKQLAKLDRQSAKRIVAFLRDRIAGTENPRSQGKALTGPLKGLWRYRLGNYRIVCDIQDGTLRILVIRIGDRRDVYR